MPHQGSEHFMNSTLSPHDNRIGHLPITSSASNKCAFNDVLDVTSIGQDLESRPIGSGGPGTEITDEDPDYGDDDIARLSGFVQKPIGCAALS
jgi:hypothetical protein